MHDCHAASDVLFHVYHAQLETVFDTAVAWETLNDEELPAVTVDKLLRRYAPRLPRHLPSMLQSQSSSDDLLPGGAFHTCTFDSVVVTGGTTQGESLMHSTICMCQEPQYCLMVLLLHTGAHEWSVDVWLRSYISSAASRWHQVTKVLAGTCAVHTDHTHTGRPSDPSHILEYDLAFTHSIRCSQGTSEPRRRRLVGAVTDSGRMTTRQCRHHGTVSEVVSTEFICCKQQPNWRKNR